MSVDAIFCVLVITGALVGGASFLSGHVGTAAWWSSVAVLAVNLLLCVICLLKGKVVTGVIGIVLGIVALVGAVRLAKPGSWWATRRYARPPAGRPRRAPLRPALRAALEPAAGSRRRTSLLGKGLAAARTWRPAGHGGLMRLDAGWELAITAGRLRCGRCPAASSTSLGWAATSAGAGTIGSCAGYPSRTGMVSWSS